MLKKQYMKKLFATLVASSMVLAATGCGDTPKQSQIENTAVSNSESIAVSSEAKSSSETEIVAEPDKLSVLVIDKYVEDFDTNYYTLALEKEANVDIEFVKVSSADFNQKLSLMINGGDELPDLVITPNMGSAYEYGSAGFFIPLNEYFNNPEAMPNFYEHVPEEDRASMIKAKITEDGNIYAAPAHSPSLVNQYYDSRVWINTEWLDKLGLDMPTTTEELYDVLVAFKTQDPNGNGLADEIPMVSANSGAFALKYLMNAFEYASNRNAYYMNVDENGNVYAAYTTEEWKNGLEYIKKLVSEDLFTALSFTQDNTSTKAMVQNPDICTVGIYGAGNYNSFNSASPTAYEPMAPVTGPEGVRWTSYSPIYAGTSGYLVITSDCDNVDAAVRLMDAFYDRDISVIACLGEPEVDWTTNVPDGYVLAYAEGELTEPGYVILNNIWGSTNNKHWTKYGPTYLSLYDPLGPNGKGVDANDINTTADRMIGLNAEVCAGLYPKGQIVKLEHNAEDKTEYTDLHTAISTYVDESIVRFVTGDMPLSDWDSYIQELDKMGNDRYVELVQKAFNNSGLVTE